MITPEEYQEARRVCLAYQRQIKEQNEQLFGDKFLDEYGASNKIDGLVRHYLRSKGITEDYKERITVVNFLKIDEKDFAKQRNVGSKTIKEFRRLWNKVN